MGGGCLSLNHGSKSGAPYSSNVHSGGSGDRSPVSGTSAELSSALSVSQNTILVTGDWRPVARYFPVNSDFNNLAVFSLDDGTVRGQYRDRVKCGCIQ